MLIVSCKRKLPSTLAGRRGKQRTPLNVFLLAVEEAIAQTHDSIAAEYGCLFGGWVSLVGDFEKSRKRRRLAMESSASEPGRLARSLIMNEVDDMGDFMWCKIRESIKKLKVSHLFCMRTALPHCYWQEIHCTDVYEHLKASGRMPLVDDSDVVQCPKFTAKPIRSDSGYSASESQNVRAKASESEDELLNDLD